MNSSAPGVVNSRSRYARRFSSVDLTPIESKRFLIVPELSSAARIPFPSATSAFAISCSSDIPASLEVSRRIIAQLRGAVRAREAACGTIVEHPAPPLADSDDVVRGGKLALVGRHADLDDLRRRPRPEAVDA